MDEKEFARLLDMVDERAAKREAKREAEAKAKAEAEAKEIETRKTLEAEVRKDERAKAEAELKAEGIVWKEGKINVVKAENLGDGEASYEQAFLHFCQTGDKTYVEPDGTLSQGQIKKNLVESTGDGAFIVPEQWQNKIILMRDKSSWPRLAGVTIFPATTDTINLPAEDTAPPKFTRTAEAGGLATDDPSFAQNQLTVEAWSTSVQASRQLLADNIGGFETYYNQRVARGLAQLESYYCAIGDGSNAHTGVFAGGDTDAITIDTDHGYSSDGFITGEALWAVYYTLGEGYRNDAVWLCNGTTAKEIATAKIGDNAGSNAYAFPGVQLASFAGGRLNVLGRPLFEQGDIDDFAANKGFLALGVPEFYYLIEREGLSVLRDPYSRANTGEVCFHVFARQTGLVTVEESWVIASGS